MRLQASRGSPFRPADAEPLSYPAGSWAGEPALTIDRAYARLGAVVTASGPEADLYRGLASAQSRLGHLLARDVVSLRMWVAWTLGCWLDAQGSRASSGDSLDGSRKPWLRSQSMQRAVQVEQG
jgi:hypothetical protein